jgi:hypothetical protein
MSVLILVLCLVQSPAECREVQPSLETMPMHECMIAGQIEGAKWVDEHHSYRLARVRCVSGERHKERARDA